MRDLTGHKYHITILYTSKIPITITNQQENIRYIWYNDDDLK